MTSLKDKDEKSGRRAAAAAAADHTQPVPANAASAAGTEAANVMPEESASGKAAAAEKNAPEETYVTSGESALEGEINVPEEPDAAENAIDSEVASAMPGEPDAAENAEAETTAETTEQPDDADDSGAGSALPEEQDTAENTDAETSAETPEQPDGADDSGAGSAMPEEQDDAENTDAEASAETPEQPDDAEPAEQLHFRGLTDEEVSMRVAKGETNSTGEDEGSGLTRIILSNVCTYFNLIFAVIAFFLIMVRSFRDLSFLAVIVSNTLIGIIQEWRSKKELDRLILLNTPQVRVIRNGKEETVQPEKLVKDDVILLGAGDQVPADARVLEGLVQVNESLLTGESEEVRKEADGMLLSGSFIISGSCAAILERVGKEAYVNTLSSAAKEKKKGEQSEMIRSLDRLVKVVGIILIPIAALLFYQQYVVYGVDMHSAVRSTAGAVIGMIPEGLYLLASVALAVSCVRLARSKVLVHNMKSIESLARADLLFVDKTGTITENTMRFVDLEPLAERMPEAAAASATDETTAAASATDEITAAIESGTDGAVEAEALTDAAEEPADAVPAGAESVSEQENAVRAMKISEPGISEAVPEADETAQTAISETVGTETAQVPGAEDVPAPADLPVAQDAAAPADLPADLPAAQDSLPAVFAEEDIRDLMADFAAAQSGDTSTMRAIKDAFKKESGRKADAVIPFSSAYKYSGCVFDGRCFLVGAPEFLLNDTYELYQDTIREWSEKGFRVLLLGETDGEPSGKLEKPVRPISLLLFENPVREHAKDTFEYFAHRGVSVRVISGDNPATASKAAIKAGIPGAEQYVDASRLTDDQLKEKWRNYIVFGRVSPNQKRLLVQAARSDGHIVAMTGDGVNDVLALHDADCSIAMASGSDAAAHAAQMVLLDSDFARMPSVVNEGRRVVNNIERTASLFLVKNIFSLLLSIFSIVGGFLYPLAPAQISLISAFTIGIPAFFMSLERNSDPIRGRFMSNVLYNALPAGLTDFAVTSGLVIFCNEFGLGGDELATACTFLLAIVGVMILYRIASPMTTRHWVLLIAMVIGMIFSVKNLPVIFSITGMSRRCVMLLFLFALITEPCMRYLGMLFEWLRKRAELKHELNKQKKQDELNYSRE